MLLANFWLQIVRLVNISTATTYMWPWWHWILWLSLSMIQKTFHWVNVSILNTELMDKPYTKQPKPQRIQMRKETIIISCWPVTLTGPNSLSQKAPKVLCAEWLLGVTSIFATPHHKTVTYLARNNRFYPTMI